MTSVKTFEITVLFDEVMVMFIGALARAGLFAASCSCTANSGNCREPLGVNIIVLSFGATAESADGAGITVERFTDDVAYPLVNEDTRAVTLAVPCKIPAVTLTTAKV